MFRKIFFIALMSIFVAGVHAQTTEFTYQGSLKDSGVPASNNYDFEFALFDALAAGSQIGATIPRNGVAVANGIFSVKLDFGSTFPGANRFLEIRVRLVGQPGITTLSPRQLVNSSPYSVRSLNSTTADVATTATQLGGLSVSGFIQNSTSPQATSNFNISGNGTAGGSLSGGILNAGAQYNIGGNRVLSVGGSGNIFAGLSSGAANTSGFTNAFFGTQSGQSNTSGGANSFFGFGAGQSNTASFNNSFFGTTSGQSNTTGQDNAFFGAYSGGVNTEGTFNSFFGSLAGGENTIGSLNSFFGQYAGRSNSTGGSNSFFGYQAGTSNTTGSNNALFGYGANVGSNNLTFASAIGAGSIVSTSNTVVLGRGADSVQIPGNLNLTGTFTGNLPTGNANYIQNTISPQATSNFNISGTGTANIFNAATQYNLGGARVFWAPGINNLFVGDGAGQTGAGNNNSFFGKNSGQSNFSNNNSFFGSGSGSSNFFGTANSFFGQASGSANYGGSFNSFFGTSAGLSNSNGTSNAYFGALSGQSNTTGGSNSFFGRGSGQSNTTGDGNNFIGQQAGINNVNGSGNTFVGANSGISNTSENNNIFIGNSSNGAPGITNATAIGVFSSVTQSNSLVLGSINGINGATADTNVGIGTTAPSYKLTISDASNTGLRVVTAGPGGTVASFGGIGAFQVDAPFNPGGRFNIAETGEISFTTLGTGGTTQLCRNFSNFQISTCSSSIRYKENVNPFVSGLSLIKQLRPVSFNWKDGGLPDMGLVAEEVAAVEPLLTTTNAKGEIEGVKYDRIGVVLINAVKEQQAQIEAQQKEITEQKESNQKLQSQMDELKKIVCSLKPDAAACKNNSKT